MTTVDRYVIVKTETCPDCQGTGCDECDYRGLRHERRQRSAAEMADLYMADAESKWRAGDGDGNSAYWSSCGDICAQRAAHYAALAQAQAQERIAAALEEANRMAREAAADREVAEERSALREVYRLMDAA